MCDAEQVPRITNGILPGPAGDLEYVLSEPDLATGAVIRRAAVLCHPHPLGGGTLNTRIVFHLARALVEMGMPVLRFNFRGVGKSAGEHAAGVGEVEDAAAALAWCRERYSVPVVLGGFSFGAGVALRLLNRHAAERSGVVERAVLAGLPVGREYVPERVEWRGPKLFISGTQDEFAPADALRAYVERQVVEPKRLLWIAHGDHFLNGQMEEFRDLVRANLEFA